MGACSSAPPPRVAPAPPPTAPSSPPCGGAAASCAGCSPVAALHIFWDTENAFASREGRASAADVAAALVELARGLAHERRASASAALAGPGLVAIVSHRCPEPLRKSLDLCHVAMRDAGTKKGGVDIKLKDCVNDVIVDFALRRGAAEALRGGGGGGDNAPSYLFIASGDGDFAGDVRRAKLVGLRVGLFYPPAVAKDYVRLYDLALPWAAVLERAEEIAGAGLQPEGLAAAGLLRRSGVPTQSPPPQSSPSQSAATGASSKKELCRDFQRGRCRRGEHCTYLHAAAAAEAASSSDSAAAASEAREGASA